MHAFLTSLKPLAADVRGVTALEYGLIAGLISVVIVTAVTGLGTKLAATFNQVAIAVGAA
jgi:pilus assembly protein Flp/PilA